MAEQKKDDLGKSQTGMAEEKDKSQKEVGSESAVTPETPKKTGFAASNI